MSERSFGQTAALENGYANTSQGSSEALELTSLGSCFEVSVGTKVINTSQFTKALFMLALKVPHVDIPSVTCKLG